MKVGVLPGYRTAHSGRILLWGGLALLLLVFVRITREFIEGDVSAADRSILLAVAARRTPWLTGIAVDVTALGSVTQVALFSAFALVVLLALRDRRGALQMVVASVGAATLTQATKELIERVRPVEVQQLVVVSGFSYPSGHSVSTAALYLTLAAISARHMQRQGARIAIFAAVSIVIAAVAASRVYLGVHYATDVVSGVALGAAWALLLAGVFERWNRPRSSGTNGPSNAGSSGRGPS